jgi:hypothetical protein
VKRIRKNKPRCRYVYFCSLRGNGDILTDEEIELNRCVLPSGHKVDGWKHEHQTINHLRFDQNCHTELKDVRKDWDYYHSEEYKKLTAA